MPSSAPPKQHMLPSCVLWRGATLHNALSDLPIVDSTGGWLSNPRRSHTCDRRRERAQEQKTAQLEVNTRDGIRRDMLQLYYSLSHPSTHSTCLHHTVIIPCHCQVPARRHTPVNEIHCASIIGEGGEEVRRDTGRFVSTSITVAHREAPTLNENY